MNKIDKLTSTLLIVQIFVVLITGTPRVSNLISRSQRKSHLFPINKFHCFLIFLVELPFGSRDIPCIPQINYKYIPLFPWNKCHFSLKPHGGVSELDFLWSGLGSSQVKPSLRCDLGYYKASFHLGQ